MLDEYLDFLAKRFAIPKEAMSYAKEIETLKKYEKGEHLVLQGRKTNQLFCVIKGVIRCYAINDEKEWTSSFFLKKEMAGDYKGSILGEPAERSLLALEERLCFGLSFPKNAREVLRRAMNKIALDVTWLRSTPKELCLMDLMSLYLEARYDFLQKEMPWLLKRVSDKRNSPFMGVTSCFPA